MITTGRHYKKDSKTLSGLYAASLLIKGKIMKLQVILVLTELVCCIGIGSAQNLSCSSNGDLRLEGGSTTRDGRVEICYLGEWGMVCADDWDDVGASVACRQLGFNNASAAATYAYAGQGSIVLFGVICRASQSRLLDCNAFHMGEACSVTSIVAGVECALSSCSDGDLRLEGGSTESEGRVEICQNGTWGTVCGDSWGVADANVVCRQLGFATTDVTAFSLTHFGRGSGSIFLDEVTCSGNESRLVDCPANPVGVHDCDHSKDAGVICVCSDGDLRLEGGSTGSQGRVEICQNGTWGTVCGDSWGVTDANVVCRQLGFATTGAIAFSNASYFGEGSGSILLTELTCSGTEARLVDCPASNGTESCRHSQDVGVTCDATSCSDGGVRLEGGNITSEGGVEVCLFGEWGTVCDDRFDAVDAGIVCRQLGFLSIGAIATNKSIFGYGPGIIFLDEVGCTGNESRLIDCPSSGYGVTDCFTSENAGVRCDIDECIANPCGDNGICFNTVGSFDCTCNDGFSQTDGSYCEDIDECEASPCGTNEECNNAIGSFSCPCIKGHALNDLNACEDIDECSLGVCGGNGVCFNSAGNYTCICNSGYTLNGSNICIDVDECSSGVCSANSMCSNIAGSYVCICNEGFSSTSTFNNCTATSAADENSNTVVLITVVPVAAVLLVIVVTIAAILCTIYRTSKQVRRRSRFLTKRMKISMKTKKLRNHYYPSTVKQMKVRSSFLMDIPKDLVIHSCNLQLGKSVGQGEFGIVYRALLKEGFNEGYGETVAVKTLKGFLEKELIRDLLKECAKMKEFDHPNVLPLRGVCLDGGPAPYIVMPFMTNGSLLSHLKENRVSLVIDPSSTDLDDVVDVQKKLLDMCLQVAKGMEYLSSKRLIHRDLAARNCMIDVNCVIKVADFGLSESIDVTKDYFRQSENSSIKLPVKWLALESMNDGLFSEKTDVWAYGVTCWEVFSGGKTPYPGVHPMELTRQLQTGLRMEKPLNATCSDEMYNIMQSCWEEIPDVRPQFSELVSKISVFLASIAEYVDLNITNTATNLPESAPFSGCSLGLESETAASPYGGHLGGDADDADDAIAKGEPYVGRME